MNGWFAAVEFHAAHCQLWLREFVSGLGASVEQLSLANDDWSCVFARHVTPGIGAQLQRVPCRGSDLLVLLSGFARCNKDHGVNDQTMASQVAYAYMRWGHECVQHLWGQWAVVVVDVSRRRIFAARDATGTRPLYYRERDGILIGNRAKLLARAPGFSSCEVDPESAIEFLAAVPGRPWATMFRGVRRLPPGCALSVDPGKQCVRTWTWWEPKVWKAGTAASDEAQVSALRDALSDAIRDAYLFSRQPCIALSSGVDSTAIAAVARTLADRQEIAMPATVSARFPRHPDADESKRIELALAHLACRSHWVEPDVDEDLVGPVKLADHPRSLHWIPLAFAISREAAANGYDSIMWGSLGDLVGGVQTDWPMLLQELSASTLSSKNGRLREGLRRFRAIAHLLGNRRRAWIEDWACLLARGNVDWSKALETRFLRSSNFNYPGPFGAIAEQGYNLVCSEDKEALSTEWNCSYWGIRAVFPLMDRRVVEVGFSLEPRLRHKLGINRYAVRLMVQGKVPDEVRLNGRKTNFTQFYDERVLELVRRAPKEGLDAFFTVSDGGHAIWQGTALHLRSRRRFEHAAVLLKAWLGNNS